MGNPFTFWKGKDPVEAIIILLGGLLVVVIAFFIARGDLDYYTEYLLSGGIFEREIEIKEVSISPSPYFPPEEFFTPETFPETSSSPLPPEETTSPPPQVVATSIPQEKEITSPKKTETPSRVAESPSGAFFVQCGAFSKPENAQKMVELLKDFGYQAVSEPVSGLYRVRIYGFQDKKEAEKVVSKLKTQGIESFVGK